MFKAKLLEIEKAVDQLIVASGRVFYAMSSSDARYEEFVQDHGAYLNGVAKVYTVVQDAINACQDGDRVYIFSKDMAAGDTDPNSWAETLTIAAGQSNVSLVGVPSGNRTQGGLPQIKKGSGTTALLTVRAPGCLIDSLGFNGVKSADGTALLVGILLDDDSSTKTAFGTTVKNCHFKNCAGSTVTDARTGGAITWAATGCAWQVLIEGNRFYKNVCDVCLMGTSVAVPQDVVIEDNIFSGPTASVDCNLYLAGGSGMNGVIVRNNEFPSVLPSLASGSVVRYVDMTGCVGLFAGNRVGGSYTTTGFGAAKAAGKIPTTVGIAHNYSDAGLIVREA